ncbi:MULTISPECIES: DUF1189 family protein [unclassified Legionella]|uniref:DUF1189 family protein n=1 Tax=unclassified Legionella TaxID=2622702 RepID=UPI0010555180|nr:MULTISPECIES: DUF1189 family protein [unclassified Legionella]MDI9819282.1 DUF1189 family protein [Legionella sp. PL877]
MAEQARALRKIDTPLYNYIQALFLSFFSRRLYVDVGKRWKGFGFRYLLLVLLLGCIPFSLQILSELNRFFDEQIIQPLERFPTIYIQNGKVSFDKPMPYEVKNDAGQVVFIIDTTGTIKTIDNNYPQLMALITEDKVFYRIFVHDFFFAQQMEPSGQLVGVVPLTENINEVFDGKDMINTLGVQKLKIVSQVLLYPSIVLVFFAMYLVFFLAFALMGQFIAKLFYSLTISYKQALRLLTVSATPHILVLLFCLAFDLFFPGFGFLLIVLLLGYYVFAIRSLERESRKLVVS